MGARIESYVHSDNATKNKAAAMVKVKCQTDFGARTPAFIDFCKRVAKFACGYRTSDIAVILDGGNDASLYGDWLDLQDQIGEMVDILEIQLMKLDDADTFAGAARPGRAAPGKYAELARLKKEGATA